MRLLNLWPCRLLLVVFLTPIIAAAQYETILTMDEKLEVEWLAVERFESDNWVERWAVETQGPLVFAEDGKLKIRLMDDNRKQAGVTIWLRQKLQGDVVIRVRASTDAQVENNACNLNFFVHAQESNGDPLSFARDGAYKDYHDIPNYLFTLTGGITQGWTRARLNPGFTLISERDNIRSEPGRSYVFLIVIEGQRIRYYLNDAKLHDYEVDEPLTAGWFGLRTWFSQVNFEEVQIGKLIPSRRQGG